MTEINNIHDTFFRETMSHKEVAADFLANYLPAIVLEQIKLDTLVITKDTFVDKKQAAHYSDLFYQVKKAKGSPILWPLLVSMTKPKVPSAAGRECFH